MKSYIVHYRIEDLITTRWKRRRKTVRARSRNAAHWVVDAIRVEGHGVPVIERIIEKTRR
jgi:hypothetical protein